MFELQLGEHMSGISVSPYIDAVIIIPHIETMIVVLSLLRRRFPAS